MRTVRIRGLLALATILALGFAACGEEEPTPTSPAASGETPPPTLKEGVLQVASCFDYPPFESEKKGEKVGFDIDMVKEIASRLGLQIEWVTHDFNTVFTALAGNQFDLVAAASTITSKRDQIVDFSDPYYASRQSLIVNTQETPDITSTDQLGDGDVVGVQDGTTGQDWAEAHLEQQGVELKTFTNITPAFQDLEAGNIVGIVSDEPQAAEVAGTLYPSLAVVEPIDTNENYGFAMSEDNPELQDAVNAALADMIADGTYAELFQKYFPDQEVPPQYQPTA